MSSISNHTGSSGRNQLSTGSQSLSTEVPGSVEDEASNPISQGGTLVILQKNSIPPNQAGRQSLEGWDTMILLENPLNEEVEFINELSRMVEEKQGSNRGKHQSTGSTNPSGAGEYDSTGESEQIQRQVAEISERVAELDQKHNQLVRSIHDNLVKPVAIGAGLALAGATVLLASSLSWAAVPTAGLSVLFFAAVWTADW